VPTSGGTPCAFRDRHSYRSRVTATPSAAASSPAAGVDAADRALRLVLLLQSRSSLGISEAARELGVARSTAHRLLSTLRHRGFAVQDEDRRYRAGPAARAAGAAPSPTPVRDVVAPLLRRLRDEVGETVHLMTLSGRDVVFVSSEESTRPLRVGSRTGLRLPAHRTSGGKVLLAELAPAELSALLPDLDESARERLDEQLAEVRACGYGVNHGETESGIGAVGVAVRGRRERPDTALALSVPAVRLPRARVPELVASLRRYADEAATLLR
jgi:IclR family acetate operon transcriptional repressor